MCDLIDQKPLITKLSEVFVIDFSKKEVLEALGDIDQAKILEDGDLYLKVSGIVDQLLSKSYRDVCGDSFDPTGASGVSSFDWVSCHCFNLHDQIGDATNRTESGSYDESVGPNCRGKLPGYDEFGNYENIASEE